jgi:hypothetical protein
MLYPVRGRAPRSMAWNMCFWEGNTKAREVRAHEASVDDLSPDFMFVGEGAQPSRLRLI